MRVRIFKNSLFVEREKGDRRICSDVRLLEAIKEHLNRCGRDLIVKRMCDDGHLTDEDQHYIRSRIWGAGAVMIRDTEYMIRSLTGAYNGGMVHLEFYRQPKTEPKQPGVSVFPMTEMAV